MRAAAEKTIAADPKHRNSADVAQAIAANNIARMISVVGFEKPSSDIGSTGAFRQTESPGGLNTHDWVATPVNSQPFCLHLRST
jgi:hypothetical protein